MKKQLFLSLLVLAQAVFAQTASEAVQAKLNAITSMSAHFNQVVSAGKRQLTKSSGNMAILRPGRFRWQTKSPMEQLVVADGKHLWVYDVDLEQVTVRKQESNLGGTPGLFLSTYKDTVARDFEVTQLKDGHEQTYALKAKSPKENYQKVILNFKGETLAGIEFFDQLGQHTKVQLTEVNTNPNLKANLFQFHPPKGTDVVRQ